MFFGIASTIARNKTYTTFGVRADLLSMAYARFFTTQIEIEKHCADGVPGHGRGRAAYGQRPVWHRPAPGDWLSADQAEDNV